MMKPYPITQNAVMHNLGGDTRRSPSVCLDSDILHMRQVTGSELDRRIPVLEPGPGPAKTQYSPERSGLPTALAARKRWTRARAGWTKKTP